MAKSASQRQNVFLQPMEPPSMAAGYAFVGPAIPAAVIYVAILASGSNQGRFIVGNDLLWGSLFVLAFVYACAAVPAAITGATMAKLAPRLSSRTTFVLASAAVGAVVSALSVNVLSTLSVTYSWEQTLAFAVLGAAGGLGGGVFALWFWRK